MRGRRFCGGVAFLVLVTWLPPLPSFAAPPRGAEALYQKARSEYYSLQKSEKKQKYRSNWLRCIGRFEEVYKTFPESDRAPDALFMMGSLYEDLGRYSGLPSDLSLALSAYQRLTAFYPSSRLADDAQFRIGVIHHRNKDYEQAYLSFIKVEKRFPAGDMVTEARKRLADLKPYRPKQKRPIQVTGIRHWSNAEYTRVVIDLAGETQFEDHILKQDPNTGKPPRIYVDIRSAQLGPELAQPIPIQDGLLTKARAAQHSPGVVRVVLDMMSLSSYRVFPLKDPFRIIIDVDGNGRKSMSPGRTHRVTKRPSLPQQLGLGIRRVVIDPGHGGKDPGAIGPGGLREKDVVLKIAMKLEKRLQRDLGLETILTRRDDVFIPLDERTAIANTRRADLFVSVHANATRGRRTRGVETYVLNFATDEESMELAARENAVSTTKLSDLQYILYDLMQTAKIGESRALAEHVQGSVCGRLSREYSRIRNLGVKEAPFYVLIGANMPCILIEVSFISNKLEERRLRDERYLDELVSGITEGIALYMKEIGQTPAV